MAAPATVDEFLDLVRKSGVADEKRLDAYLQKQRAAMPPEPSKAAGMFVRDGLLTHFQAEQIIQGKWRRFSIGKYKVLERIGSGGMGSVYLCEHKLMRRRVAVKVLPAAKAKDPASLDRFIREARAVAALDHINIVHAYDIDQDEELHFLVMEYVDGANLQDIVKKVGPMEVERACHYIYQSALGLEHAFQKGLLHRDIKPGNILVDRTGTVKVLDMGLARFFNDEDDILTKKYDENVLGTADYLSPEQALDSHAVDIRADIYSLGATFYFMLTGRTPFGEGTVAQKLLWHQSRHPKPISDVRKDVPAELSAIIVKMMAKRPEDRYATPAGVVEALAPYVQNPIGPPPESEMPRLSLAASGQGISDTSVSAIGKPQDASLHSPRVQPSSTHQAPKPPTFSAGVGVQRPQERAATPPPVAPKSPAPQRVAPPQPATVAPPRPQPAPQPARPVAVAPKPAPPPPPAPTKQVAAAPAPARVLDDEPWENLADDTADPSAKADTAPSPKPTKKPAAPKKPGDRESRRWKTILAVLAIPVVITLGVLVWFNLPTPENRKETTSNAAVMVITRDASKPNSYRKIQHALRIAPAGAILELHDELHEENLVIDGSKSQTEVVIQAASHLKEVRWMSASKKEEDPILKLSQARNFKLKGRNIVFDGNKKVKDLVYVQLQSPGLELEDADFRGFSRSAVFLMNAGGLRSDPIRLQNLSTLTEPGETPAAAIYFDANPEIVSQPFNDYIEVKGCQFLGIEPSRAIGKKDAAVVGANVELPTK
jgi:serine/threonine protein kinase